MAKLKAALAVLALLQCGYPVSAQTVAPAAPISLPTRTPTAAPLEPGAIPLYGAETPGSVATEVWSTQGKTYSVRNVTRPTLTPFLPNPVRANGTAVLVAPGGAFMALSMEGEGWDIAKKLADHGIAAFVLKYRLIETPKDNDEAMRFMGKMMMAEVAAPMNGELLKQSLGPTDAKAALAMIRAHAAEWHVDPTKVGMIGFSAGAMTARRMTLDAKPAARPDFVGYIYGPQDAEPVPADAPPLFDAIALDDPLFPSKGFPIATEWLKARRPVEIHGYQRGSHGFGAGRAGTTTTLVLDEFLAWMTMNHFLPSAKK